MCPGSRPRFYVESNGPYRTSETNARKVESAGSSSVLADHCNYFVSPSSHTANPDRITSFRITSNNSSSSCWVLEFQRKLHTHDSENYRHHCESDWDGIFQCQPIQSRDYYDR